MFLDRNTPKHFKVMLGSTGDGKFQAPHLDEITHTLQVISDEHHEIHEEKSFTAYFAITTAATNGHRSGLYLKTPIQGGIEMHMVFSGSASTAADLSISEAPTIAANTVTHTVTIYTRHRNSTGTSGGRNNATTPALGLCTSLNEAQINGDGTWATGTVLRAFPLAVGSGPKPAGSNRRGMSEYVLKADTAYVLLLTNTASSANDHLLQMDWYEHIPLEA